MREFLDQIADYMSRELALNGWIMFESCAIFVLVSIFAIVSYFKVCSLYRRLIAKQKESTYYQSQASETLQRYGKLFSEQRELNERELARRDTFHNGNIKSLNEKLRNATEQNRRLAVEQAIAILKTHHLPVGVGGIDIHAMYREIYRFLAGKA